MRQNPRHKDTYVDANGRPTELVVIDGQEVVVHYDDIPESDITTVHGIRCTTPLRTLIDLAPELTAAQLDDFLGQSLQRRMFSIPEALARIAEPDLRDRPGARILRRKLLGHD